MTDAEREQMIRAGEPSENERLLLGLLDEARRKVERVAALPDRWDGWALDGGWAYSNDVLEALQLEQD